MKKIHLLAASLAALPLPILAQTTYTSVGVADNNAASQWDVITNWDLGVAPGSLLNGGGGVVLDDIVILRHNEGGTTSQRIRLVLDAGTIGSLEIGGIGTAGSTGNTQLQMRGGSGLIVTGDVILGSTFGGGQRGGQINFANGAPLMSVAGSIVSGSTNGGNNVNVNSGGTFTLTGDIDSAAARAAIDGVADQEIDVTVSRTDGLVLDGVGAQELNLESFNFHSTGANVGSVTQTIGLDKTINALNGRVGSVNNNDRVVDATLTVDGGVINYTNNLVVGRTQNQNAGTNNFAESTGTLVVGDVNPGSVTVGGQLILGQQLGVDDFDNLQVANGNVVVNNAGSVLNLNAGVNMGATVQPQPTQGGEGATSASLTVNDGQVNLTGAITEDVAQTGNSTITVNGGELALLDAVGGTRTVDTLSHLGGTIDFTIYGGMPALATTDTALGAVAGDSVIDVTTAAPGSTFSTTEGATWTGGGTGATPDGEWDAEVADWDVGVLPSGAFGPIGAGEDYVVITSTNAITGDPAAAVLSAGAMGAGWTLAQNTNDVTLTAGAAIAGGTGAAIFTDGTADVTRATDLNIEAAAGTAADATGIEITDVSSLALTAPANLNLGGATAGGAVNQGSVGGSATGGMAVTVGGSLVMDGGGVYTLNEGTLAVGGASLVDPADNGLLIINSPAPNSFTSTGAVTLDRLSMGRAAGTNTSLTVDYALSARLVDIAQNTDAQAAVTIASGGSLTTTGRVYVAGDQTNNNDQDTVGSLTLEAGGVLDVRGGNLEIGRDGAGTFTVDGGTYTQFTNNLVLGQNGNDPDTNAKGILVVNSGVLDIGEGTDPALPNLNINGGGGSFTLNDGIVTIENALNLVDQGDQDGVVTINGGTLNVGGALAYRTNGTTPHTGTDTVTLSGGAVTIGGNVGAGAAGTNFLIIDGPDGSVDVTGNLNLGGTATLQYNVDPVTGVKVVTVGGTVALNAGTLNVTGLSDTSLGDLKLVDVAGVDPVSVTGNFAGLLDGDAVLDFGGGLGYRLSIRNATAPNDGNDIWLMAVTDLSGDSDSDGDGMPDTYETANGLDPNVDDSGLDKDGDGFSNLFEYAMGTLAGDGTSAPTWEVTWVSDTEVNIKYGPIVNGVTYNLNASTDGELFSQIDTFTAGADAADRTFMDTTGSLEVELYQLEIPLPLP